jgi:hypothetical protein
MNGFLWETYHQLEVQGFLNDVETTPWNQLNPHLHFVSHLPMDVLGEQLIAQLFRCAPEHSWLFKYGRVPMSYLMHEWVWDVGFSTQQAKCSRLTRLTAYLSLDRGTRSVQDERHCAGCL